MRVAQITSFGGPEVFHIVDRPQPAYGQNEVLVRMQAASVNPVDTYTRRGTFSSVLRSRFPLVLGRDGAGTVVGVGKAVTRFRVGDDVFFMNHMPLNGNALGTYAEYTVVPEDQLAHKPANISHQQAAGIPVVGLTSWRSLIEIGKLQANQQVLIHGGSGGVGSFAIQLAKCFGATVTATCSAGSMDLVWSLGADAVIDYSRDRFENTVHNCDLVFDTVGVRVQYSLQTLRRGGKLVAIVVPASLEAPTIGTFLSIPFRIAWLKLCALVQGKSCVNVTVRPSGEILSQIAEFVEAGKIKLLIDSVYPLERVSEAHRRSETRHAHGKVILSMS